MRKLTLTVALVASIIGSTAAQAFNPQPDPPGKMVVNARFERAIDNPDIREVSLTGTLRCRAAVANPSTLRIKIGQAALFYGATTRGVTCKYLNPSASRPGGSWSGDVVGTCNRKPAVAHLLVSDDTRGGGDIRLSLKGSGAACTVAVARKHLLGSLTASLRRT